MSKIECMDCEYFEEYKNKERGGVGACFLNPPINSNGYWRRPETHRTDFCSHAKPRICEEQEKGA